MTPDTLVTLFGAGQVERYHSTLGVPTQSVAEHSWGVALIHAYLSDSLNTPLDTLTHDLAEVHTGDIPFPAKRTWPGLRAVLHDIEEHWWSMLSPRHKPQTSATLKTADYIEGALYCARCYLEGYVRARQVARVFLDASYEYINQLPEPRRVRAEQLAEIIKNEYPEVFS